MSAVSVMLPSAATADADAVTTTMTPANSDPAPATSAIQRPHAAAEDSFHVYDVPSDLSRSRIAVLAGQSVAKGERGGLNLFKWRDPTSTTASGWREGDRMLTVPWKGTPKATWKENASRLRHEMRSGEPIYETCVDDAAKAGDDVAGVGTDLAVRPKLKPGYHYLHQRKMERSIRTADVLDAYKHPLKVGEVRWHPIEVPSILFQGRNAQVAVNPWTGKIVSAYPTGSKLRGKLLRDAGLGQ